MPRRNLVRADSPLLHGNRLDEVLNVLESCGFIFQDLNRDLHLTPNGQRAALLGRPELSREVILVLIERYQPSWARLIPKGRRECLPNLPSRVSQCMSEAGLANSPADKEVVIWWHRAVQITRIASGTVTSEAGLSGELLTLQYERLRTGREPDYVALETVWAGYDILSVLDPSTKEQLKIEVKASWQRKNDAYCYLSSNEWRTAQASDNYVVDMWLLTAGVNARLARVTVDELEPHMSKNRGEGVWTSVKVPFRLFEFQDVPGLTNP